jgi:two-component system chemotaxis response regulator CheY
MLNFSGGQSMHPTLSMLIVDDNVRMRSIVAEINSRKTVKVLESTGGIDALFQYRLHRPDWIIMETTTERMDGLAATELIHNYFPQAKVMLVSPEDTPEMRQAAHQAGASAFVPRDNLLQALDMLKP